MISSTVTTSRPPASVLSSHRRLRGKFRLGGLSAIVGIFLLLLLGAGAAPPPISPLVRAISSVTAQHGFDLVRWEVVALVDGIAGRARGALLVHDLDEAARRRLVEEYFQATSEAGRLHNQLDARQIEQGDGQIAELQSRLDAAERQSRDLTEAVTEIIAGQIQAQVAAEGINTKLLDFEWHLGFPPVGLNVTPPVFFRFSGLPLLLVVAPRDKIAVVKNDFLLPSLTIPEMERLEGKIDQENASSVILPIGGFAAYPSMIPTTWSHKETLQVVAHEWTHHYLAMHPLGQRYFANYALRSINETVADMVGDEIGGAVYARYYQDSSSLAPTSNGSTQAPAATYDFGKAMVDIRQVVEVKLSQGDVAGAEQYMLDRKDWLATKGYHLRKLNTAYLTFFGAYAGSGNSYEPKLRHLRERSKSLGDFLHRVENISSERDFEALAVN